jgi:hypothetical protein
VANKGQCPTCAADIWTQDRRFVLECAAEARSCEEEPSVEEEEEFRCPCGWGYCDGDCGTLPCGCIDTCRGKCEL